MTSDVFCLCCGRICGSLLSRLAGAHYACGWVCDECRPEYLARRARNESLLKHAVAVAVGKSLQSPKRI